MEHISNPDVSTKNVVKDHFNYLVLVECKLYIILLQLRSEVAAHPVSV